MEGERQVYSFCESTQAGPLSPWHIRRLTSAGRKCSGGIDTPSLCGRVTPKWNGWDLTVEVDEPTVLDRSRWAVALVRRLRYTAGVSAVPCSTAAAPKVGFIRLLATGHEKRRSRRVRAL
jgi:hypothetical protein